MTARLCWERCLLSLYLRVCASFCANMCVYMRLWRACVLTEADAVRHCVLCIFVSTRCNN